MIYISEIDSIIDFNNIMMDYSNFENLYETVGIQPVFLGLGTSSTTNHMHEIPQIFLEKNLKLTTLRNLEIESFIKLVRSVITSSESFQSTIQGSCDINFE